MSALGGEHPAKSELKLRKHTLGGEIHKAEAPLKLRNHKLGGSPGNGAVTDKTPQPLKHHNAKGTGAEGY